MTRKVIVIGLDCLEPSLAFKTLAAEMPFLNRQLRASSASGLLRSTIPPITIPAWASMLTGKDPGELGLYGFRNRTPGSYALRTADATDIKAPWIGDTAKRAGKSSAALFVPPSTPITHNTADIALSCFLHDGDSDYASSYRLAEELEERCGAFVADVAMEDDPQIFRRNLFASGRYRFDVLEHVLFGRGAMPDLTCFVDIGPDRLHHQCFRDALSDRQGLAFETLAEYYAFLDARITRIHAQADTNTSFVVVSDHGAQACTSGFYLNQWLVQQGYLHLRNAAHVGVVRAQDIDFCKTQAWGEGGYYGRVMLNVKGREPSGIVARDQIADLTRKLQAGFADTAQTHRIVAQTPTELYGKVEGFPPDLLVSIDDYACRVLGSYDARASAVWGAYDDVAREPARHGCNHAPDGVFVRFGAHPETACPRSILEVYGYLADNLEIAEATRSNQ